MLACCRVGCCCLSVPSRRISWSHLASSGHRIKAAGASSSHLPRKESSKGALPFLVNIFSPVFLQLRSLEMYFKLLGHSQTFSSWFGVWMFWARSKSGASQTPFFSRRSFVTIVLWCLLINDGKTTSQAVSTASLHTADCTGHNNWCVPL